MADDEVGAGWAVWWFYGGPEGLGEAWATVWAGRNWGRNWLFDLVGPLHVTKCLQGLVRT